MNHYRNFADIRRDYGDLGLNEEIISPHPLVQFQLWFEEVLKNETYDPTAMVLSTVDEKGNPDSRVVLLKGLTDNEFVFFTNYQSSKAQQIASHPYAALNFYWPHMCRQVRVRGKIKKVSKQQSDEYFSSRPIKSQYSAIISPQSQIIQDRAFLENALHTLLQGEEHKTVNRPKYWGGYKITPEELEFWQGRDNRLHDRILYCRQNGKWKHHRLAP